MEMGTHLFDWIRLFAGDLEWAHAHLLQLGGRESAIGDIKHTREVDPKDRDSGLVLGERGSVSFRFKSGIHAQAEFLAEPRANDDAYGLDLVGTEGRMALRGSVGTELFIHRGAHQTPAEGWRRESLASEDMDEEGNPRDMTAKRLLLPAPHGARSDRRNRGRTRSHRQRPRWPRLSRDDPRHLGVPSAPGPRPGSSATARARARTVAAEGADTRLGAPNCPVELRRGIQRPRTKGDRPGRRSLDAGIPYT